MIRSFSESTSCAPQRLSLRDCGLTWRRQLYLRLISLSIFKIVCIQKKISGVALGVFVRVRWWNNYFLCVMLSIVDFSCFIEFDSNRITKHQWQRYRVRTITYFIWNRRIWVLTLIFCCCRSFVCLCFRARGAVALARGIDSHIALNRTEIEFVVCCKRLIDLLLFVAASSTSSVSNIGTSNIGNVNAISYVTTMSHIGENRVCILCLFLKKLKTFFC